MGPTLCLRLCEYSFQIILKRVTPHFHVALDLENYVADAGPTLQRWPPLSFSVMLMPLSPVRSYSVSKEGVLCASLQKIGGFMQ